MGIADCDASWKPDGLIKSFGAAKAKNIRPSSFLITMHRYEIAWGLQKDSANAILLDKNGICRAIVRGRVPDDQVAAIVQLAIDLQNE